MITYRNYLSFTHLSCLYVIYLFQSPLTRHITDTSLYRYADRKDAYWTGYFTSRPALKRYARMLSGYYLVLFFFSGDRTISEHSISLPVAVLL